MNQHLPDDINETSLEEDVEQERRTALGWGYAVAALLTGAFSFLSLSLFVRNLEKPFLAFIFVFLAFKNLPKGDKKRKYAWIGFLLAATYLVISGFYAYLMWPQLMEMQQRFQEIQNAQ